MLNSQLVVAGRFASETGHSHAGTHTAADAGSDKDDDAENQNSDSNAHDTTNGKIKANGRLITCGKR